jgi:hypothetical protein
VGTGDWFRQDRHLLSRVVSGARLYRAEAVVTRLLSLFVEVEAYWRDGVIGRHLRVSPGPQQLRRASSGAAEPQ